MQGVDDKNGKVTKAILFILLCILIAGVLYITKIVFIPFVIALLLSFVLAPAVNFLMRLKIPRGVAIAIVLVVALGFCFLFGFIGFVGIRSIARRTPEYQLKVREILSDLIVRFNLPKFLYASINWSQTAQKYLFSLSESFFDFVLGLVIIIFFLVFLLLERPYLKGKVEKAFPSKITARMGKIFAHLNSQIGRYLTVKLIISLCTGFCVWGAFKLIGTDFPLIWGVLAFILNFIPHIGSGFIIVTSAVLALIQFYPYLGKPVLVLLSTCVINMIFGNFLEPKFQGARLNLSPFLILFSLIFWGWLWGIVGMILAVPLTVIVKIVCENVPYLRPISILMGTGKRKKRPKPKPEDSGTTT